MTQWCSLSYLFPFFSATRDNQLQEMTFTHLSSDLSHPNPQRCCRDEHGVREDLDPHVDAHRVRVLKEPEEYRSQREEDDPC